LILLDQLEASDPLGALPEVRELENARTIEPLLSSISRLNIDASQILFQSTCGSQDALARNSSHCGVIRLFRSLFSQYLRIIEAAEEPAPGKRQSMKGKG